MEVSEYPENIYIGITDKCNAKCIMCWRNWAGGPFLDISTKVLAKLKPALKHASFIGWWGDGEFFCHKNVDRIIGMMKALPNASHAFSTNGKMLGRYAKDLAVVNVREITISIDGATPATLRRIRRGVELSEIVDGLKALYAEFDFLGRERPFVRFYFVSMMSNIYELPALVTLASSLSVPVVFVSPLNVLHHDLESESLPKVAPGLEKRYFNEAALIAEKKNIELIHCNPAMMG